MCVHPESEWSGFFALHCELFTSCNVPNNASLVSARTKGEGLVNQMWTDLDRGRWGGVPKIPKFVPTFFMDDPKERQLNSIFLLCLLLYRSVYINLSELDWILFNIAGFVCVVWTDISVAGLGLLYGCTWWWNICENNFGFIDVILFSIHKKLKSLLLFMIIL